MSHNIIVFKHKNTYINRIFHTFGVNTSFEDVINWCIDNNCSGFSKNPDGLYSVRDPTIEPSVFIESIETTMLFSNNSYFYVIENQPRQTRINIR